MNKNKGITLVALVVTIIILIILASISINLLFGQYGIVTRAKYASSAYEKSKLKEELELEIANIKIEKNKKGEDLIRDDLYELEKIGAVVESIGIPAEGEYKDYFFEIDENYAVTIIGKLKGEKPTIVANIITEGIVGEGQKIEIKVTAQISEGTIQTIEATNGATLKTDTSNTEKVFEVNANGIYYFKTKADNGRSAVVAVTVDTIMEKPKISIKNITVEGFTIGINTKYKEGLVKECKYYIGEDVINEGTVNTEYTITGLEDNTEFKDIYVEVYFSETNKIASEKISTKTNKRERIYLYNNGDLCTNISGGWSAATYPVDNLSPTMPSLEFNEDNMHVKVTSTSNSAYQGGFLSYNNNIDLSKYKRIGITYTASLSDYSSASCVSLTVNNSRQQIAWLCYVKSHLSKESIILDISNEENLDTFNIYLQSNKIPYGYYAECNIYEIWLE